MNKGKERKKFLISGKGRIIRNDVISYIEDKLNVADRLNAKETQVEALRCVEFGERIPDYLMYKINKYCDKYGYTFGEIVASIASSRIVASQFAKLASRQSIAQKAQIEYINYNNKIDMTLLPSTGVGSIRLQGGELVVGNKQRYVTMTKSIDAVCGSDYICLKWTNGFGGAQDNQASDALLFITEATEYTRKHNDGTRFVAILDGAYYKKYRDVFKSFETDRVIVANSDNYVNENRKTILKSKRV